jgi:hypothetical protein
MYLLKCDHVFIVAKISRAITDQSLKSSLYTVLARHAPLEWEETAGQSFRIAVVCTKSEVSRSMSHWDIDELNYYRISIKLQQGESFADQTKEYRQKLWSNST